MRQSLLNSSEPLVGAYCSFIVSHGSLRRLLRVQKCSQFFCRCRCLVCGPKSEFVARRIAGLCFRKRHRINVQVPLLVSLHHLWMNQYPESWSGAALRLVCSNNRSTQKRARAPNLSITARAYSACFVRKATHADATAKRIPMTKRTTHKE
jgi:hypothetical protein